MDLVYSVSRKPSSPSKSFHNHDYLHEGPTLCSISSRNIVAFTTITELHDATGKTWGSHVYVADLNVPWHSHKLLSNNVEVTALEWDLPGGKLLVADSEGQIQIWAPREHLLNEWTCLATALFPGEHILAAAFFHNGRKIGLLAEKKDSTLYSEKFSHLRFAPSVRHFGGRPLEGCVLVSSTGMVGVVALSREGSNSATRTVEQLTVQYLALTASESLGSTRHRITAVDICYGKNGHFLVAVSGGNTSLPVQCYRVSVKKVEDKISLTSQALPSFFLQCNALKDNTYRQVVQLRFVVREDADSLVVTANGETSGLVEIWELREKPVVVHKLFQRSTPSTPPPEPFKTIVWQHQSHWLAPTTIRSIATTKASLSTAVPPPSYVMIALNDCSLHCLYRDSLKQVATAMLSIPWRGDEPSLKMSRATLTVSAMDLTWAGSALLVADTRGQLYLYRVLPVADPGGGPLTVPYAVTLLEYCLMSGMDWWDVLLALRPSMLEAVCERFSESFLRQPAAMQQYHYAQYLCIKTSLYRLCQNGQPKASDLSNLLMLHSVATAFKSLLRPSDLANHDKGPADSLSMVMAEPIADISRALLNLEPKEFTVEPSTLQSLQQLIQWVADLALNLLARLPEHRQPRGTGYELIRDLKAINELRELLVIIRIWGLVRQTCLPVFVQSADNLDILALCFKLLSRMVQSPEPDESLIDECLLLPSQVMIPQLNPTTPVVAVMLNPLFYQTMPIQMEYGIEPENLQVIPDGNPVEGALQAQQVLDSVRHIFLGKRPLLVRICCRCGGMAQAHSTPRTPAIRAWDQRWAKSCRCGGRWRLHKFSL